MAILEKLYAKEDRLIKEFGKEELFDILTKAMDKDKLEWLYDDIARDYEIKFEDDEEGQQLIDKLHCLDNEESTIDRIHLSNIIDGLNERERKLVVLRYFRDKTQSEIAESLGVSQVQVSRLESKVIEKIRKKY